MSARDPLPFVGLWPAEEARIRRIGALWRVAGAVLADQEPERLDSLFLHAAIDGWLRQGGDLTRDFLRVNAPRGSHWTAPRIAARLVVMGDEAQTTTRSAEWRA